MLRLIAPMIFLVLAAGARAETAQPVTLDADLRAALAGLAPLAGPAPELAAGQPVVVTFFASWCPPCRDEFRHLGAVLDDAATAGTTVIAINWHEDFGGTSRPARLRRFLKLAHPRMSVLTGTSDVVAAFGGVPRIPSLWVFDREGREVHRFVHGRGATKTHATQAEVRAALLRSGA